MSGVASRYIEGQCHQAIGSEGLGIWCECGIWVRLDEDESDEGEGRQCLPKDVRDEPMYLLFLGSGAAQLTQHHVADEGANESTTQLRDPIDDSQTKIDFPTKEHGYGDCWVHMRSGKWSSKAHNGQEEESNLGIVSRTKDPSSIEAVKYP